MSTSRFDRRRSEDVIHYVNSCYVVHHVFRVVTVHRDLVVNLTLVRSFSGRNATHAWDPLSARALVLDNSEMKIALVVVGLPYCR